MAADDRSFIEANTRERERMRALVDGLDDDALGSAVNEYWTVAGVLGHIAYLGHPRPGARREDRSRRTVGAWRC